MDASSCTCIRDDEGDGYVTALNSEVHSGRKNGGCQLTTEGLHFFSRIPLGTTVCDDKAAHGEQSWGGGQS